MNKIKFEYKIVSVYLVVGCLWILFSDHWTEWIFPNPEDVYDVQTYKGFFYVLITAVLFYYFLRRYLKKLRAAEKKALESDRLKSAFLANMSREIRNPMNGIIGFSKILLKPDISGEQKKECAKIIEESGKQMLTIINDLLALSNLESAEINLHLTEVNVNERLRYLYDLFKDRAEIKNISFLLKIPEGEEKTILKTDKDKFSYVVRHLLINVFKLTENGTIELGYQRKHKYLCFYVKDSSIDLPENQLKMIFKQVTEEDQQLDKMQEGLGLSLPISKAYVEILGGKIWVESKEKEGLTFCFTLPIRTDQ